MAKSVTISAPGKVILHGEHAVVYGKKALACSLNLRSFCQMVNTDAECVSVALPDINLKQKWSIYNLKNITPLPFSKADVPIAASDEILKQIKKFLSVPEETIDTKCLASVAFLYLYLAIQPIDGDLLGLDFHISSNLPTGAGLGSSAAYSTCLATALLINSKVIESLSMVNGDSTASWSKESLDLINGWAFQSEKIIHGTPSGIDNSVSTFGGALLFQQGKITPLDQVPNVRILLINTKVPRSTKQLIGIVKRKHNDYPNVFESLLCSIEAICVKCCETFASMNGMHANTSHYTILNDLIKMNQKLLDLLGVSHKSLQKICDIAEGYNLAGKLTGAGGGGCAFVIIPPCTSEDVIKSLHCQLSNEGYDVWETSVGAPGVLQHFAVHDDNYAVPKNFR